LPALDEFEGLSATDILKARGITRLVYFHSDHFEPWRYVPGRAQDHALAAGDIERYVAESAKRDFARPASLFYKANFNYVVDGSRELWRADPADPIGFAPPTRPQSALAKRMLSILRDDGRDLQVHVHHENITWNDRIRDERVRAHLADPANRRFDDSRFELLLRLTRGHLSQFGMNAQGWFFVHGHWALNASDPHECTIVREIEILRRNGGLGDFTQPSGRPHTDSRIDAPYLVHPVAQAKGYDRPEADPIPAAGAGAVARNRFLIWASEVNHRYTSIDHYSGFVRDRMRDPSTFARGNAAMGFAHDGVLYVKTHAHSMAPAYWAEEGAGPFPHEHPGIIAELGALFDAASQAKAVVEFATVGDVYRRLMEAPAPAGVLPGLDRLQGDHAMTAMGCDVGHRNHAGVVDEAPRLSKLAAGHGKYAGIVEAPVSDALVWPVVVPLPEPGETFAPPEISVEAVALAESIAMVAQDVTAIRAGWLGGPEPEVTSPAELLPEGMETDGTTPSAQAMSWLGWLVDAAGDGPVVDLGCALPSLAAWLGARGRRVTVIDRDLGGLRNARAIAAQVEADGMLTIPPVFQKGRDWAGDGKSIVIVTGLQQPGRAGQAAAIRQLAKYNAVIVDLSSFLFPRDGFVQRQEIVTLFEQAGFEATRILPMLPGGERYALFQPQQLGALKGIAAWVKRSLTIA